MKIAGFAALSALLLALSPVQAADDGASAWAVAPKSRARLVATGPLADGAYRAGVEIRLDGKALTYWRTPGEAGVPPVFDFSKSTNLAAADVSYPAPFRLEEAGAEAYGYLREVIFPIRVTPRDPAQPVRLDVHLNYASCEVICIPAEATMQIALTPKTAAGAQDKRLAAYEARVPKPLADGQAPATSITPLGAAKPKWLVRFEPQPAANADLFAEGPDGWFFDTKRRDRGFELILAQKPKDAALPVRVVLTYRDGERAFERAIHLDGTPAKP